MYNYHMNLPRDCKMASGKPANNGYYRKSYKNKVYLAHRLAYILAYSEPPKGYDVHHLCHDRQCIEPTHLVAMTKVEHQLQEIRERGLRGAAQTHAAKTHCKKGHLFDGYDGRQRYCPTCRTEYKTQWMKEKRAARSPEVRERLNTLRRERRRERLAALNPAELEAERERERLRVREYNRKIERS